MLQQTNKSRLVASIPSAILLLMLAGLLFSRAVLSISHALFLIFFIVNYQKQKSLTSGMLSWSLFALLLPLLGCWQMPFTARHFDLLLTWSMYPIAFLIVSGLDKSTLYRFIHWCRIAACAGIVYALSSYLLSQATWTTAYGTGQSLPTFMDTDHVRFGLFLCGIGLLTWLSNNLSVRTKLIYLLFLLMAILFMAVRNESIVQRRLRPVLILLVIMVAASLGFLLFPTVQQKWAYTVYDWQQYAAQPEQLGYSDGARRFINSLAWDVAGKYTFTGAGWANIAPVLQSAFAEKYPGQTLGFGWPFNQWLFWWLGSGIIGMVSFTAWLLYPLIKGWQEKNSGIIAWTTAITASCWVESTLSLQYGVWLHAWILAFVWQLTHNKNADTVING
jgi:O-antigen ligase